MRELERQKQILRDSFTEAETWARKALLFSKRRKWRHAIESARELEVAASAALIAGRNIREIERLGKKKERV